MLNNIPSEYLDGEKPNTRRFCWRPNPSNLRTRFSVCVFTQTINRKINWKPEILIGYAKNSIRYRILSARSGSIQELQCSGATQLLFRGRPTTLEVVWFYGTNSY